MPIPDTSDFESARRDAEIAKAQPVRIVHGGATLSTIAIGTMLGVFFGMWLFAISAYFVATQMLGIVFRTSR